MAQQYGGCSLDDGFSNRRVITAHYGFNDGGLGRRISLEDCQGLEEKVSAEGSDCLGRDEPSHC